MELKCLVINLAFSDVGPFTHPKATVRVLPADADPAGLSAAFIDVQLKLSATCPPGASLQAIADAAVQQARAVIQPTAASAHLQSTLDWESAQQLADDAAMARALGSQNDGLPLFGG